ncbi:MAG: hypothetical protein J5I65_13930, partial [Aridibacter famidurans]|nr:hypothetical protein [Aridibacter famidurans]
PPGWPMILTVGTILGFPWLVNPILTGLNVLLCYIFLKEIYPDHVSRLSSFLLGFSPWAIFLGMSLMNHTSTLTLALLGGIGIAFSRRTGSLGWAFVAGACVGFTSLIRPLDAVAIGVLLGVWAIGIGGFRIRFAALISFALGTAALGGFGLYYNWLLTGDPLKIPIMEYLNTYFGPNANAYGFGADRGMGWSLDPNPGHSPIDALINSNLNVSTMSVDIFGWSIGGFLLAAIFILRGRLKGPDGVMIGVILVVYILYFFYYFAGGPEFSARYWYIVIVPMCALTVRGIEVLSRMLKEHFQNGVFNFRVTLVFLTVFAVAVFIPWRAIDKYHNLRGMRPDIRHLADNWRNTESLILIKLGNDAYMHPDFDSAMVYNPLDLNANAPVYAWDRHSINCWDRINCKEVTGLDTRRKLLEHYIDRQVWIVRSPSSTGRGFEIEAGPVDARELLKQEPEANAR